MKKNLVAIIMGSLSDAEVMHPAKALLDELGVACEFKVVSAHRSPHWMYEFAGQAEAGGIKIIIAGAGGAAHLPGMIASLTTVPVIGVPVKSANSIQGIDSLLSIVQMPNDVPVASVGINNARNAAILAAQMLAIHDASLKEKLLLLKEKNRIKIQEQNEKLNKNQ